MENGKNLLGKLSWSTGILLLGCIVFLIQMTFVSRLPSDISLAIRIGLSAFLLVAAIWLMQRERYQQAGTICYLFFTAATALLISTEFGDWGLRLFGLSTESVKGMAVAKFSESVPVIILLVLLPHFIGMNAKDLFIAKGRLWYGLGIGLAGFLLLTLFTFFMGDMSLMFKEGQVADNVTTVLSLMPWVVLFTFSNGIMEELLFRGLFLKKISTILNFRMANILTAFIFAVAHVQVQYVVEIIVFLIAVFMLGLFFGRLMQKTESLIAPALIHAGVDVIMILPLFSTLM